MMVGITLSCVQLRFCFTDDLFQRYAYLEKLFSQDFVFQPGATAQVPIAVCSIVLICVPRVEKKRILMLQ